MTSARHVLDRVQSLVHVTALANDPGVYVAALADEVADATTYEALAARDDQLREALAQIDGLATRVMRIHLDHVDPAIALPTRKVFAATVVSYAGQLDLLASRSSAAVVDAAVATLAVRDALRADVLALASARAATSVAIADAAARDPRVGEVKRRAWSALRRELEVVAAQPARLAGVLAARLATWPDQIDEPDPVAEPTLAELIELD